MTARSRSASSARGAHVGLLQRTRAWFARKVAGIFWISYFTAMASTVGVALE